MKFDSTYRNSYRSDHEQFSRFLSGQNQAREACKPAPVMASESSSCGRRPIGMVYCEYQEWKNIYDIELGMTKGTIFEELDLPFERSSCRGGRSCRG